MARVVPLRCAIGKVLAYWKGCNDTEKLFDVALVRAAATHPHSALIRSCDLRFQMNTLLEQSAEGVRLPLDVPALSCTQVVRPNCAT